MLKTCAIDSTARVDHPRYFVCLLTSPELGDRAVRSWRCSKKSDNIQRELYEAMNKITKDSIGPDNQFNSFGCSIKWKTNEWNN